MNILQRLRERFRFGIVAPLFANRYHAHYLSHAQFGEDMIARHLLAGVPRGFYVDIGAHHPVYSSNTAHFYKRGWRGINIDAVPGSMEIFRLLRPRDINLEACIDTEPGRQRQFIIFDQPALNTLCPEQAQRAVAAGQGTVVDRKLLTTTTINELLQQHLPAQTRIDLLSIDIEGLDEPVLRTLEWDHYRPRVIILERRLDDPLSPGSDPLLQFLAQRGYGLSGLSGMSVIMQEQA